MSQTLMLTGDVNLMNVADPSVPFKLVAPIFAKSDFVFSNLECCFYIPPGGHSLENEGFFAEAHAAEALKIAGIQAVGIANNVNYGEAAITRSIARLDEVGIPHTGAGANRDAARAPVILEKNGVKIGFLQYTARWYQDRDMIATATEAGVAKIASIDGITIDAGDLGRLKADLKKLRPLVDVIVVSHHNRDGATPVQFNGKQTAAGKDRAKSEEYQRQFAHAALFRLG